MVFIKMMVNNTTTRNMYNIALDLPGEEENLCIDIPTDMGNNVSMSVTMMLTIIMCFISFGLFLESPSLLQVQRDPWSQGEPQL